MEASRLVLVDAGPVLKFAEIYLQRYNLSRADRSNYLAALWEWIRLVGWCPLLTDTPDRRQNLVIVCADSVTPYWRQSHCEEYKGHRGEKSGLYLEIRDDMMDRVPVATVPGYEADDVIAFFCRQFQRRSTTSSLEQVYILTVDHDLMGLVSEDITWLGLRADFVRSRDPDDVYDWLAGKYPKTRKGRQKYWQMPEREEFQCSDIWKWKSLVAGDQSDGLTFPRGNQPEVALTEKFRGLVDLHNPMVPMPTDKAWATEAIKQAKAWEPTSCVEDLEIFVRNDMGLDFPVQPIPLAPPRSRRSRGVAGRSQSALR